MSETNPLLAIPFDIRFDQIEAHHVQPAIDALIADAEKRLDVVRAGGPATYASTLGVLETADEALGEAVGVVGHLEAVATTPALREAYNEARPKASAFWSRIPLDAKLYGALEAFAATDEAKGLAGTRARFLTKTLDSFRRHGAGLDPEKKKRLETLDVELAKKTTTFSQNVLDETNAFELVITDEARLAGLPESARSAAQAAAEAKGIEGWRFTLQGPSYIAAMTYLDDAAVREQLWRAYNTRATAGERDNRALIHEILTLRREKAELLGYADFADFVLEDRMAKSGAAAMAFVDDLRGRTQDVFAREQVELQAFRDELEGDASATLAPWDVGYYAEKLRKARFDFDEELLRPYFPVDGVLAGLFELTEALYGVTVRERPAPTWNDEVRCFGIYEGADSLKAAFYVDLFPREDKRGGAWMNALKHGHPRDGGGLEPHLGLFCANVTRPVGDKPALLTHREVETLFHEFGHLLHHAFSDVSIGSLGGTNVAWDFVELPSQIMENFCWERASLDLFAKRWDTGETIPDALFDKMIAARTFRAASAQMRQLGFASVDLVLHREVDPRSADTDAILARAREVLAAHSPTAVPDDYAMICGFTHLFAGPTAYASGYYSYKWAEVLDADAFTRFAEAGVVDREVGQAFRASVLSQGDADDPEALYRAFMGREPKLDALLKRLGLS